MKLSEANVKVFDLFFNWLYAQKLWDKHADKYEWSALEDLYKLYVFAYMARVPRLKNQFLDTMDTIMNILLLVRVPQYEWVWENTATGSHLRDSLSTG